MPREVAGLRAGGAPVLPAHRRARGSPRQADRLTIRYAGGGGYGLPDRRDRDRVLSDLRHGYITDHAAREVYRLP